MVVKRSQAAQGHDGEQLHVRGPHMEMRVWENVPCGYHFAPHDCTVDIAGFITQGSGLWLIDGQEVITSAGDSYYLPAGSVYGLIVLRRCIPRKPPNTQEALCPVLQTPLLPPRS